MIDTNYGWIKNYSTSKKCYIKPKPTKNLFTNIIIGMVPIIAGVGYIVFSAFHNGARAYETAELNALDSLDLLE